MAAAAPMSLQQAAREGNTAEVLARLEEGADVNQRLTVGGLCTSALVLAAGAGHFDTVEALAANGADLDAQQHFVSVCQVASVSDWLAADGVGGG
ncbi:hypothetical protein FNF31_07163 [Cafeteria roenbergensis]|uniref:Uncharacterized protein n=1 Tax=Cafeteria roenbergensis TaxID=33653 RepID=A0A5A8C9H7_CAFRO|nr:hypothetical protein FNF31_07163 [Cafeteria roenbergensis]